MPFNSLDFALFLPMVFILYWFVFQKSFRLQNILLLVVSYVFYGWWDWRFLSLILFSTLVDYCVGLLLGKTTVSSKRKALLWVSLVANLGLLGFFKYYNFFIDNWITAWSQVGITMHASTLQVILPVGISFYTFQTLSYTLDIYRRKLSPTSNFIEFAAFVSFFPQLVAGPIERATHLLPQFQKPRSFDYGKAVDGLRQILWGLFKKVVIADSCAKYVDTIFSNYTDYHGSTLVLGAFLFAFQIYGDFSGYSDIAIGTARLFGFHLMKNFSFPYFSRDIAEFWRRWHISLSTWFRDYIYIPLGGSRGSRWHVVRNIFIIFVVSGFWHGANWTFIVWGALNALYFLPLLLLKVNRSHIDTVAQDRFLPSLREIFQMGLTFALTVLAWVFFRAESVREAFEYLSISFSSTLFALPEMLPKYLLFSLLFFVFVEWLGRLYNHALERLGLKWPSILRYLFYLILAIWILLYSGGRQQDFIYFQF